MLSLIYSIAGLANTWRSCMNKLNFRMAGYLIALSFTFSPTITNAAEEYSFGIVPQQSGNKLAKLWSPVFQYIKENADIDLRFATARNINTFEKRLDKAKYDFVYVNPYHYTIISEQHGYSAFAKAKKKRLKGILVVQKDSPYRSIKDLDDSELAFPSNAFAANLVPRAVLNKKNLSFTSKYVSSHDSVYRNIARGRYPAGGGVMRTFRNASPEYRKKLRVLWTSDGYTPHAFAAHPRVPAHIVEKLQKLLLKMEKDPQGLKLLKKMRFKGIEKGKDKEWDDVRALNIKS